MNFIQLVGRIQEMPKPILSVTKAKYSEMVLSVVSNFMEFNGEYRDDHFPVRLWRGINDEILHSYKVGKLLSVKGRVELDGDRFVIIAEHLEFLFP